MKKKILTFALLALALAFGTAGTIALAAACTGQGC
jgi:hypothetical protein